MKNLAGFIRKYKNYFTREGGLIKQLRFVVGNEHQDFSRWWDGHHLRAFINRHFECGTFWYQQRDVYWKLGRLFQRWEQYVRFVESRKPVVSDDQFANHQDFYSDPEPINV